MDVIDTYLTLSRSVNEADFVAQSHSAFLLKRPYAQTPASIGTAPITFETRLTTVEVDPYAAEWRLAPVKKRVGNPFPDRISIGRATNCDIVVRLPSISKAHAHIVTDNGRYCLMDNGAANFTFVNRVRLDAKVPVPIKSGDKIGLGSIEFLFVDARTLYTILNTEVPK